MRLTPSKLDLNLILSMGHAPLILHYTSSHIPDPPLLCPAALCFPFPSLSSSFCFSPVRCVKSWHTHMLSILPLGYALSLALSPWCTMVILNEYTDLVYTTKWAETSSSMRILFPPENILNIPNSKTSTIPKELETSDVRAANPSFRGKKANEHKLF